jgi:hypothetical protein
MKHGQVFNDNFPSVFRFLVSLGMTSFFEKRAGSGTAPPSRSLPLPQYCSLSFRPKEGISFFILY